jgi:predicted TIM-barrel fold metal-dependent hydrolase
MDRREFLAASAVAVAGPLPAAPSRPMLPVIDTHQHLWNPGKIKLSWLTPGHELDRTFGPAEYADATAGLNVVKSVYMEVDVVPESQQAEADYVIGLCESKSTPMVAAVIGGSPEGEAFPAYAKKFEGHKYVKGIRRVLHADSTPPGFCLRPTFVKNIQLLGDIGLSFDLCVRPAELPDMAKLVSLCPNTRFILDHCGNPNVKFTAAERDAWRKGLEQVAANKNVVCKVSGFVVNAGEGTYTPDDLAPYVNATVETFGIDRVMFGGDWPVCTLVTTYKGWLTMLREIISSRPEADQRKLLHDNAAKFYGI